MANTDWHTIIRHSDSRLMWTHPTRDGAFEHMGMLKSGNFRVIPTSTIHATVQREDMWGMGSYLV